MTALPPLPNPSPAPTPPPPATGDGYRLTTPPFRPPGPGLPPASLAWLLWLLWWLQQRERDRQETRPQPEPTPSLAGTDNAAPTPPLADYGAEQLLGRALIELIVAGVRLPPEAAVPSPPLPPPSPDAMPAPLAGP
jgi:hypothetical protein